MFIDFRRWYYCHGHELPLAGSGGSERLFPHLRSFHRRTDQALASSELHEARAAAPTDHGEYLLDTCPLQKAEDDQFAGMLQNTKKCNRFAGQDEVSSQYAQVLD